MLIFFFFFRSFFKLAAFRSFGYTAETRKHNGYVVHTFIRDSNCDSDGTIEILYLSLSITMALWQGTPRCRESLIDGPRN